MTKWKFHIAAISSIIIAVTTVFYATGRLDTKQVDQPDTIIVQQSPYSITITEASWGLNCIDANQHQLKRLKDEISTASDEEYDELYATQKKLEIVPTRNNVLTDIRKLCDGKKTCKANPQTLGLSSAGQCSYGLDINYLCYSFGKTRHAQLSFDPPHLIDCKNIKE